MVTMQTQIVVLAGIEGDRGEGERPRKRQAEIIRLLFVIYKSTCPEITSSW